MTDHDEIRAALDPSTGYRDLDDRAREWLRALLDENEELRDLVNCDCDSETRKALDVSTFARAIDAAERMRLKAEVEALRAALPTDDEIRAMEAAVVVVRVQHGPDRGPVDTGLAMVGLARLCRDRAGKETP